MIQRHTVRYAGLDTTFAVSAPDDVIQRCLADGTFFDVEELEDLLTYVPAGATVLDIGANVGNHAVFFAVHGHAARVVPFEVNPAACRLIEATVQANALTQVDLSHLGTGLARTRGVLYLRHSRTGNLGATAFTTTAPSSDPGDSFSCAPLDELVPADTPVGFVKMDVEGMEFEVLGGATALFDHARPALFIENFGWVATLRLLGWLVERNYRIEKCVGPNYLLVPLSMGETHAPSLRDGIREWVEGVVTAGEEQARPAIRQWLSTHGTTPALAHAGAEILIKLGDEGTAWAVLAPQASRRTCVGECQTAAHLAARHGDSEARLRALLDGSSMRGFDASLAHELADLRSGAGHGDEAYARLRAFVEAHPASARAHHAASMMAERLGQLPLAVAHARRVVELEPPGVANFETRLADLLRVSGDVAQAGQVIERVFARGSASAWAEQVRAAVAGQA